MDLVLTIVACSTKSKINGKQLAPLLGENSIEVLKELKYTREEIDSFLNQKISSSYIEKIKN